MKLTGLRPAYKQAYQNGEPTLAWEYLDGAGSFLFLMFFDADDLSANDRLLVLLRRTKVLLSLKVVGSDFFLLVTREDEAAIRNELGLKGTSGPAFNFQQFLERLNAAIPSTMSRVTKIELLQGSRAELAKHAVIRSIVDEASKTVLRGPMALPPGKKPREQTIRKLALYFDAKPQDIDYIVSRLKARNQTLAWTTSTTGKAITVAALLSKLG